MNNDTNKNLNKKESYEVMEACKIWSKTYISTKDKKVLSTLISLRMRVRGGIVLRIWK